jgi:hypothetical protein
MRLSYREYSRLHPELKTLRSRRSYATDGQDAELLLVLRDAIKHDVPEVTNRILGMHGHPPALKMPLPLPPNQAAQLLGAHTLTRLRAAEMRRKERP